MTTYSIVAEKVSKALEKYDLIRSKMAWMADFIADYELNLYATPDKPFGYKEPSREELLLYCEFYKDVVMWFGEEEREVTRDEVLFAEPQLFMLNGHVDFDVFGISATLNRRRFLNSSFMPLRLVLQEQMSKSITGISNQYLHWLIKLYDYMRDVLDGDYTVEPEFLKDYFHGNYKFVIGRF